MNLDSNCFKTFQTAAQTLNFTEASRLLGMTQSGVSQHVAKLESDLKTELFMRVGKKVILTESGKALLKFIEDYQEKISTLRDQLQEEQTGLVGKISYAMPITCLVSPHFNLFLHHRKNHFPNLDINMELDSSQNVIQKVLEGEIDFGFVTKKITSEDLNYDPFCDEEYVLISSQKVSPSLLAEQFWIQYPESEHLTEAWLAHHKRQLKVKVSSHTNSLHAALTMVAQDVGIMVVPRHCVDSSELKTKLKIHEFDKKPCKNTIYIVSLKSKKQSRRVLACIEAFQKIKKA